MSRLAGRTGLFLKQDYLASQTPSARGRHPLFLRPSRPARCRTRTSPTRSRSNPAKVALDAEDGHRRPEGLRDPPPAPERRRKGLLLPLRHHLGQAPLHLAGAAHRRRPSLPARRRHQEEPRRHGRRQDERPPSAPDRGPGLPGRIEGVPEAPRARLGRDVLHPGPDPGHHRIRRRPGHPGHARVRHPRAFDELVRRLPRIRERAGPLRDRAQVRRLRPGLQPGRREDLSLLRRLLQGDGRTVPRPLPPHRRGRGRRPPVGRQPGHPGLSKRSAASPTTTPCRPTSTAACSRS